MLLRAAELFGEGMSVREVAATLRISKSEAGRLRIRAIEDGVLSPAGEADFDNQQHTVQ
jgi:transposase